VGEVDGCGQEDKLGSLERALVAEVSMRRTGAGWRIRMRRQDDTSIYIKES
jgi:hypothetical protein